MVVEITFVFVLLLLLIILHIIHCQNQKKSHKISAIQDKKQNKNNETLSIIHNNPSPSYYIKGKFNHFNNHDWSTYNTDKSDKSEKSVESFIDSPQFAISKYDDQDDDLMKYEHNKSSFLAKKHINKDNLKIYLINMKKSVNRYKRFRDAFSKTDIKDLGFKHIEAVNGKQIDIKKYLSPQSYQRLLIAEQTGYRQFHYELTRGAVGCYLSHMNTYKDIAKQFEEYAIIFEDDVKLVKPNILQEINNILPTIPRDWDILLLGCVCFVCGKFSSYYDVNRYFLMHGYIIRKSSAQKIIDILENEPIEQQIDAKFCDLVEKGLLKIYCLRNKLAVQWDMGTNIQLPVKSTTGVNPFDPLMNNENNENET